MALFFSRQHMRVELLCLFAVLSPGWTLAEGEGPDAPAGLTCELLGAPHLAVITDAQPEFSWMVNDLRQGAVQTAYQIQVASSEESLRSDRADCWESGKVNRADSVAVEYEGKPLRPNCSYWWRVRTWDARDRASPYSSPQCFNCGGFADVLQRKGESRWTQFPEKGNERLLRENLYGVAFKRLPPRKVIQKGPGHYLLDFGRAAYGTLALTLSSESEGRVVELHLGEKLNGSGSVDRNPGGTIRYRKSELETKKGTHEYVVELPRQTYGVTMPSHLYEVMPFRYCEVVNSPSAPTRSQAAQLAAFYPFDDAASSFNSSSLILDRVWDLCKYSIKATTALGIYIDGDRERKPYEADAYINQLGHYSVDREYALGRYSHEYLMYHPTWPTEWILHSVPMAWADFMYTGERDSLRACYKDLKAKALLELAREDGLISSSMATPKILEAIHLGADFPIGRKGFRDIVDWPTGETDGFEFRPVNSVVNAFYYGNLVLMQRIALEVGQQADSQLFAERARLVYRSFNESLFDPGQGVYVDGEGSRHASLHTNMFAAAFGLVPKERKPAVARFLKSRGMACSVYGAQWLLEALYELGEEEYALELMTDRDSDRSWPHMIEKVGTTITLEAWDIRYKPNLDWNHAWGAAPANIIPRKLMGVEPLAPGFARVRIRPRPGSLHHASARVPTIRGPMLVEYRRLSGGRRGLRLTLPANCRGNVVLPVVDMKKVRVQGKSLAQASFPIRKDDDGGLTVEVPSGSYEFLY